MGEEGLHAYPPLPCRLVVSFSAVKNEALGEEGNEVDFYSSPSLWLQNTLEPRPSPHLPGIGRKGAVCTLLVSLDLVHWRRR